MAETIRVAIADDHALLREGVRALLESASDVQVVAEAASGEEAIAACREHEPDVLLLDVAMPGLGGLEAAAVIHRDSPRTRILVLTQYADRQYVARFLKIGVSGYVLKKAAGAELVSAIRAVMRGGLVLDPGVAREAMTAGGADGAAEDPHESLTDRERQVLKLLAEGHSNKDVAQVLGISVKTAMSHREHLMRKLGVHNRTELVRYALRRGVVPE